MGDEYMIFISLGIFMLMCVIVYFMYQITRLVKNVADIDEKYSLFEIGAVTQFAKTKSIDLKKIKAENSLQESKSFRKQIEKKIIADYFDKEKDSDDK